MRNREGLDRTEYLLGLWPSTITVSCPKTKYCDATSPCKPVSLSSGQDVKHTSNKVGVLLASNISARRFLGTPSSSRMCTKFSKRHTRLKCLIFSSPYTRSINPSDGSLFGAACCLSGNVFNSFSATFVSSWKANRALSAALLFASSMPTSAV